MDVNEQVLHVVRGEPDDAELAALVVALNAVAPGPAAGARQPAKRRSTWVRPAHYQPPGSWSRFPRDH